MTGASMKITPMDSGIEEILWEGGPAEGEFPESTSLIPSESPMEAYLSEILHPGSLDEHILASMVPQLNHREITIPARYQNIVGELHTSLCRILDKTGVPEARNALQNAVKLLEEQKELTNVLNAYRKLLMQG
jgi:hypothetical protein